MLLELIDIHKSFKIHGRKTEILSGISFSAEKGEMIAIMGESGAGKSTLLNIAGGILRADSGKLKYDSDEINIASKKELDSYRREHIGFIVQDFALISDRDVEENIAIPLRIRKINRSQRSIKISQALTEVGLNGEEKTYPCMMSGGEQQRVAIARALATDPDIILADEPTGSLDSENADNVLNLLRMVCEKGKTVIIVTHDKEVASKCNRIVKIERRRRD